MLKTAIDPLQRREESSSFSPEEKALLYGKSSEKIADLLRDESDPVVKMTTISCILKHGLPYVFWVGFYRVHPQQSTELIVGPYQGTLGCIHIPFSKGVCGAAAREQCTIIIPNVHLFPGHISCDSRSRSEIVVPVFNREGSLIAVFDVDSELLSAFDEVDKEWLERILREQFFG